MRPQDIHPPEARAARDPARETNYGSYGADEVEAGLPPWCRAARALLRMGAIVLGAALAAYGLFPL